MSDCPHCDGTLSKHGRSHTGGSCPNAPAQRWICDVAADIRHEWKNPYFGSVPYLDAMRFLKGIDDTYGCDSAKSIVCYFLANAQTFRGARARELKAELKKIAGIK